MKTVHFNAMHLNAQPEHNQKTFQKGKEIQIQIREKRQQEEVWIIQDFLFKKFRKVTIMTLDQGGGWI